jgi:DNA repair exonuclease SbcCD ATPase subunit
LSEQIDSIKNSLTQIQTQITPVQTPNTGFNLFGKKEVKSNNQEHLLDQLSDLNQKVSDLEKTLVVGIPLAEATDGLQKLENMQRQLEQVESKLNLYISNSKELKEKLDELNRLMSSKVNRNQVESLSEKIAYLEKLYSELSVSKVTDSLVSLVDIVQSLRGRIKSLEGLVEGEVLGDSSQKLDSMKLVSLTDKLGGMNTNQTSPSITYKPIPAKPVEEKKGLLAKLIGVLFGK